MGTKKSAIRSPQRGVRMNGDWLIRQMQLRAWSLKDFVAACEAVGMPVSDATISVATQGRPVDKSSLAAMVAALEANPPIIPEEAII